MQTQYKILAAATAVSVTLIGISLYLMGQPPICTCGYVKLWDGNIFSSGNSQHIADWYTLSHVLHGVLIALLARWLFPRARFLIPLSILAVTGVGWELIEHSEWVLERFRATTINQGYTGDSILNSVCDYLFMTLGFMIVLPLRTIAVFIFVLTLELTAGFLGRDNLSLSTLMLVYPIEAVKSWQEEIRPE